MRYYDIQIVNPPSAFPLTPNGMVWSSHPLGDNQVDPSAQEIILNIDMQTAVYPSQNSVLEVKGVSWDQIRQTGQLIGKIIRVYAGMKPGLPLATLQSRHKGLLFQGQIVKCFGNWEGTETSIGMNFGAGMEEQKPGGQSGGGGQSSEPTQSNGGGGSSQQQIRYNRTGFRSIDRMPFARGRSNVPTTTESDGVGGFDLSGFGTFAGLPGGFFGGGSNGLAAPLNVIHDLRPNMLLSDAIRQTLSKAFPQAKLNINISPMLKLAYQDAGMYENVHQYAAYINQLSQSILGVKNYRGVQMSSHGNTITVWDTAIVPPTSGLIEVTDLIGQPTWVEQYAIHVKTVLRPDLHINDVVELPSNIGYVNVGPEANYIGSNPQRDQLSFSGKFRIFRVLHTGAFRSPHGQDWSTNYEMEPVAPNAQTDAATAASEANAAQNPSSNITEPTATPPGGVGAQPQAFGSLFKRSVRR